MGKKKKKKAFITGLVNSSNALQEYCADAYFEEEAEVEGLYELLMEKTREKASPITAPGSHLASGGDSIPSHASGLLIFPADDTGNADRFTRCFGDVVRFNTNAAKWYVWNGKYWCLDELLTINSMAEYVATQYREEAKYLVGSKDETEKRLLNHSRQSCNSGRVKTLVEMLKHRFSVRQIEFDKYPDKLTVSNGIVDLRTGELLEFDPTLLLTQYVDVEYVPDAYYGSTFSKFIESICGDDKEHQGYLQNAFGYGITGEIREQVMFIEFGSGSNGKTTLNEAVSNVMCDFVKHVPIQLMLNVNNTVSKGRASSELAQSFNRRILIASEGEEGGTFNESVVKLLTGSSTISARDLFKSASEYKPKFKIFLDTNHLPHVTGKDYAIWRRLKVIPFKVTISEDDKNTALPEILGTQREKEAILTWLIEGAVHYYREGLVESRSAMDATIEYIDREDTVRPFLKTCVLDEKGADCSASELHVEYKNYCSVTRRRPENSTVFGLILKGLGYRKKRSSSGYVYLDIRINSAWCV